MLSGRVDHQLDEKKRMRIPKAYLNAFGKETLYFVEYAPDCLSIMPESVKDRRLAKHIDVDPGDPELMDAMRFIYESVVPAETDNQGRTKIPKYLRDYAGLEKEIVIIGLVDFIEVWDKDRYEAKKAEMTLKQANSVFYNRKPASPENV